jgi:hypothetical protein
VPLRVSPSRSLAALLAALLGAACSEPLRANVVVLVDSGQTPRPEYLTFTWLSCNDVLVRERRVPESGNLSAAAQPIASIYVELSAPAPTERSVLVTGMAGGQPVSQGMATVRIEPGVQARVEVHLTPGRAADADHDGIPDLLHCLPVVPDAGPPLTADAAVSAADSAVSAADTGASAADTGASVADVAPIPADARPVATPEVGPAPSASPLNAGLVGAWHFDETDGSVAHDSSGGGNDAPIVGGVGWKPGKLGGALDLGVTGIRASIRDPMGRLDVGTGDFSLSVWINTRQVPRLGQWPDVLIKVENPDTAQATGYELVFSPQGDLIFQLWPGSSTPFDAAAPGLGDGRWHHIVCREAGGTLSLHVDGRMVAGRRHERTRVSTAVPLRLGGGANPEGDYDGLIDELRIYSRALTDTEITALAGGAAP